jgi:hypothetical protein
VAYWVKIIYDRENYVIDLDRIGAFSVSSNHKITFWLPNGGASICIHPQSNAESYQKVLNYLDKIHHKITVSADWIKFHYDREEYLLDLNRIGAFSQDPSTHKISFWLPDSGTKMILHPHSNADAHRKILEYIERKTGYYLS